MYAPDTAEFPRVLLQELVPKLKASNFLLVVGKENACYAQDAPLAFRGPIRMTGKLFTSKAEAYLHADTLSLYLSTHGITNAYPTIEEYGGQFTVWFRGSREIKTPSTIRLFWACASLVTITVSFMAFAYEGTSIVAQTKRPIISRFTQ